MLNSIMTQWAPREPDVDPVKTCHWTVIVESQDFSRYYSDKLLKISFPMFPTQCTKNKTVCTIKKNNPACIISIREPQSAYQNIIFHSFSTNHPALVCF